MNRAMFAAASGMAAEQSHLDSIAGNLANAEEVGFKGTTMEFSELTDGRSVLGTAPRGERVIFGQGKLVKGGGPFDLAIEGQGFFVLHRPDGSMTYTRDGRFERASDGTLRSADGGTLAGVRIPGDARDVRVGRDGSVTAAGEKAERIPLGTVMLATFSAPERLRSVGGTTFLATPASGGAHAARPGVHGAGTTAFGMLEKSNVSILESMMEILSAQRAFEANSKGVQAADEMQRIANNINRGS